MVRVGMIGYGMMAAVHGRIHATLPNVQLVAIADIRPERGKPAADKYGAKYYDTAEEMLQNEQLDFVDICLPTFLHAKYAIMAAKRGLHVLCEKPMALNTDEATAMIEAARANNVNLMIAHCIRFWPEYALLKEYVDNKTLGSLRSLSMTRVSPLPGWTWDGWVIDEPRSGGAALDLHIHDVDYALYLLGTPSTMESRGTRDTHGVSHLFTTMTFGDVAVHLEGGWDFPATYPFKMSFRAVFERGALIYDRCPLTIYEDGKEPVVPTLIKDVVTDVDGGNLTELGGYYPEIVYFVDCLQKGIKPELVTPESARLSVETVRREIALVDGANHA